MFFIPRRFDWLQREDNAYKTEKRKITATDDFNKASDELIEKEMIKKVGLGSDGEPEHRLITKAFEYLDRLKQLKDLKQNSTEEILKLIAQGN